MRPSISFRTLKGTSASEGPSNLIFFLVSKKIQLWKDGITNRQKKQNSVLLQYARVHAIGWLPSNG